MVSDPSSAPTLPKAGYFLGAWCLLLIALFLSAGLYLIQAMRTNQQAASQRHAARIDPKADESGVTAADREIPAGAKPTDVTAGIYVDRVVELSVKDVS